MSLIDVIKRVDSIFKKYNKYDVDKQKESNISGDDALSRLYDVFDSEINSALQKSETAAEEKNRAATVAMNAEIRRTKAKLLEELPKMQRLALKKVKGSSREESRSDLAGALKDRIEEIPDGSKAAAKQGSHVGPSGLRAGIKFD